MKRILLFLFTFLFALAVSTGMPAYAQETQQNVVMDKGAVSNGDYFASGDTVNVLGTINGDAYVCGGNVTFDGTVNGDIIAAGGNVTIRGTAQNVRVAGGEVLIDGTVEKNVTVVGGNVTLGNRASLKGSIVAAGGSVRLSAPVGKGASLAGGNMTIEDQINGNVSAATEQLMLLPQAKINGNLDYLSNNNAQLISGATVRGKITHNFPDQQKAEQAKQGLLTALFVFKMIDVLSLLIIGLLLVFFTPRYTQHMTEVITKRPWASLGLGFLILILGPIISVILLMTIIGIPIGILFIVLYLIFIYFAKIYGIYFLGERISSSLNARIHMAFMFIIGLIIYVLLALIPIIGGLVDFIIILLGLGGMLIQKAHIYAVMKKQKEL